jgi:hypothetical protein
MLSRLPRKIERKSRRKDARINASHRAWVRRHHCSVPGCMLLPIECAHVRGGTDGGMGLKPSDHWAISLCQRHHAEQHRVGEQEFERRYDIDLTAIARQFSGRSPHLQ